MLTKEITIDKATFKVSVSASTPIKFGQVFHTDLVDFFARLLAGKAESMETNDIIPKLAYIMSSQAEGKKASDLTEEDFYEWLDRFSPLAFSMTKTQVDILNFYLDDTKTLVESKKKNAQQQGK